MSLSAVHYRFRNERELDTITFEGSVITVLNLKKRIVVKKKLDKGDKDFDLLLTDQNTGQEYKDESYGIRKNSTIIVRRVSVRRGRKLRLFEDLPSVEEVNDPAGAGEGATDAFGGSVYSDPKARAEEDRMKQFVAQASVAGHITASAGAGMGYRGGGGTGVPTAGNSRMYDGGDKGPTRMPMRDSRPPPPTYICHRCGVPGTDPNAHWIQDCPTNGDQRFDHKRPRRALGIPRTFLKPVQTAEQLQSDSGAAVMLPDGAVALAKPNEGDFARALGSRAPNAVLRAANQSMGSTLPPNTDPALVCPICHKLFTNAVTISCCFTTFCDECIRQELTVDNNFRCPSCKTEDVSPETELRPNKKLQERVDAVRRENKGSAPDRASPLPTQPAPPAPPAQGSNSSNMTANPNGSAGSAGQQPPARGPPARGPPHRGPPPPRGPPRGPPPPRGQHQGPNNGYRQYRPQAPGQFSGPPRPYDGGSGRDQRGRDQRGRDQRGRDSGRDSGRRSRHRSRSRSHERHHRSSRRRSRSRSRESGRHRRRRERSRDRGRSSRHRSRDRSRDRDRRSRRH